MEPRNPQFQSSRTGFQNGKHTLTTEKSECLPPPPPHLHSPPRPRSPAFIDTLSSCLRDGTQESYLSSFSKPNAVVFFSKPNLLYLEPTCTFGMVGAKHTQTDTHDRFSKKIVLVTFVMWTESKQFSRKGISWIQNNNLITQYEHE